MFKMKTTAVLLSLLFVTYFASACLNDSECGAEECCLNTHYLIMTKREGDTGLVAPEDALGIPALDGPLGTCTAKGKEGESCAAVYTCGSCQEGLQCVEDTSLLTAGRIAYRPATCQLIV